MKPVTPIPREESNLASDLLAVDIMRERNEITAVEAARLRLEIKDRYAKEAA